jgi:ribosomal protein S18 acetylase RimI-like enzyme
VDFIIRRVNKSETEQLANILKDLIARLSYYNEDARASEIRKYGAGELLVKIKDDPDSVLVAIQKEQIVGFCLSRFDDMLLWIEWFGVVETERKKGIARSLVKFLESTASTRNAHKVWCDCRTENIKSINLLSSSGYTPICSIKNHWYGQDFILWQKETK